MVPEDIDRPIFHAPINQDHIWSLRGPNGMLVSIDLDTGEYKFGDNYTPTEAAEIFWEAVGRVIINHGEVK
jgi:hypothetical protein